MNYSVVIADGFPFNTCRWPVSGCSLTGPWFVGEILNGQFGACFIFGFVLKDAFIATKLTYIYGVLQVFYCHVLFSVDNKVSDATIF